MHANELLGTLKSGSATSASAVVAETKNSTRIAFVKLVEFQLDFEVINELFLLFFPMYRVHW